MSLHVMKLFWTSGKIEMVHIFITQIHLQITFGSKFYFGDAQNEIIAKIDFFLILPIEHNWP
jgi:hypothetical protein